MATRAEVQAAIKKAAIAARDTSNPERAAQAMAAGRALYARYQSMPEDTAPATAPELGKLGQPKVPVDAQGNIINSVGRIPAPGKRESALTGNPIYDALAGFGETYDSTWRGIKQIATDDPAETARLKQDEADARLTNTELDDSTAGQIGKFLGYGSQLAVPVAAAAAAPAVIGATGLGAGLATVGAEGLAGAGVASLAPITGEESRTTNALYGGAINAAIPMGWGAFKALPVFNPLRRGIAEAAEKGVKSRVEALRKAAGKQIGELSETASVKLQPYVSEMKRIRQTYGPSMADPHKGVAGSGQSLNELINLGERGATILKDRVQALRTSALRNATEAKGQAQTGFEHMQRLIDDAIDAGLPTNKAVKQIQKARTQYRTAQEIAEAEARKKALDWKAAETAAKLTVGGEAERFISH